MASGTRLWSTPMSPRKLVIENGVLLFVNLCSELVNKEAY